MPKTHVREYSVALQPAWLCNVRKGKRHVLLRLLKPPEVTFRRATANVRNLGKENIEIDPNISQIELDFLHVSAHACTTPLHGRFIKPMKQVMRRGLNPL